MASNKQIQTAPGTGMKSFLMDSTEFTSLQGEKFVGLNILKLTAGQAAAGLVVCKIGVQTVKGRGKEKNKTREIPSYSVTAPDGKDYRLPLNRSLVDKLVAAKLKVGDTIAVACGDAYTSKDGNKGISYELVVQKRK